MSKEDSTFEVSLPENLIEIGEKAYTELLRRDSGGARDFSYRSSSGNKGRIVRSHKKKGRVTVTITVDGKSFSQDARLSEKQLNATIAKMCKRSDGSDPVQGLIEGLLLALWRFVPMNGYKMSRGKPKQRSTILNRLSYATAWTYDFVRTQLKEPGTNRHPRLLKIESTIERLLKEWNTYKLFVRARILTAHLVIYAYKAELRKQGHPLIHYGKFNHESFYRTWVQPKLAEVEQRATKNPKLRSPSSNSFLRKVLRIKANSPHAAPSN